MIPPLDRWKRNTAEDITIIGVRLHQAKIKGNDAEVHRLRQKLALWQSMQRVAENWSEWPEGVKP
jgi:hypothetical protein